MSDEERQGGILEDQSLDDLFKATVDQEKIKDVETRMALPAGTYTVVPPMQTTRFAGEDGSETIKLWGKVEGVDPETGKEVKGSVSYSLGHFRRNGNGEFAWEPQNGFVYENNERTDKDSGKPDSATKNYTMAVKTFKAAYGAEPNSPGDVITFLRDYAHRVRLGNYEGRNNVFAISPVK